MDRDNLVLDYQNSIVLPAFDIASILENKSIQSIILSLFLLDSNKSRPIHITINPFDMNTGTLGDGLSSYIYPVPSKYLDFTLPRELFEKTVFSTKRLLVRVVDMDARLIFSNSDNQGLNKDPRLTVEYSNHEAGANNASPPLIENLRFFNVVMKNSQVHFGQGNNVRDNAQREGKVLGKIFWYVIVPTITSVVASVVAYFFFGIS